MKVQRKAVVGIIVLGFLLGMGHSVLLADEYKDAKKAYEMGQNDQALSLLVIKLRKDNDHQDAIALFKLVLPLVIDKHQKAAQDYESRKDWDNAFKEYEFLINVNNAISSITPLEETKINGKKVKKPIEMPQIDLSAQRENVINNAAEAHYQKGVAYMKTIGSSGRAVAEFDEARKYITDYKDCRELSAECLYRDAVDLNAKKDYKNAVMKFRRCQEYIPGYKDAATLAEQAKQAAIRRIAVIPFSNLSGKTQFGEVGQILTDRIISVSIQSQPEFLEFVTREYVEQLLREQAMGQTAVINENTATKVGQLTGIHAFVFGKVLTITASYPPETQVAGTDEAEVVVSWKPYQTAKIYGSYIKYTRQGYVEISGSFQIVDVEKGTIVKSESITKRMEDRAQWVVLTGGKEEALSRETRSHNTTGNQPLEPAEALATKALEGIARDLSTKLTQFFQ
ncbi:MAG: hypothetical protein ILNGONEN_02521 [Syntrophorhabdaceae bacterium]|nr:hypothetical protein [Syntrophorhabdaceae bacterium]